MKFRTTSFVAIAAVAALAGCAAPVDSSESTSQAELASTSGGVSATLTINSINSGNYKATIVVTNNGNGAASNWQVGLSSANVISMNVSPAEVENIGGVWTINPGPTGSSLAAGASVSLTVNTTFSGTYSAPSIVTVDGEANGTAGLSPDGVDHIARTAASGALGVAFSYENNKLANSGDSMYPYYDGLIWAAQSYVISNGQIAFDPNVPGYQFIPQQAMAALATIQQDASVAEYLVSGLASCFATTNGQTFYDFDAATLKGFPTTTSGTLPGGLVPPNDWKPSPYNPVDTYTVASKTGVSGSQVITVTEKSTNDYYFGMLVAGSMSSFSNTGAVLAKFTGGSGAMCSPFNGPGGGTANPYLVITLNGSSISARMQQVGAQCQNGCTSTITLDPIAYTIPGPQYDTNNNLLGPQSNPFTLDPTDVYADPSHAHEFSTNPNAQYGTFSKATTFYGQPVDKWLACGLYGSGC